MRANRVWIAGAPIVAAEGGVIAWFGNWPIAVWAWVCAAALVAFAVLSRKRS